jgi:transposase
MGVTVQSFSEPWFHAKAPWVEWVIEGERRVLERSQKALARKRENGFVTGTTPLGFTRGQNGELVRDEYEEAAIARAKQLASGRSLGLVAQIMTDEGYETRAGTAITHTAVLTGIIFVLKTGIGWEHLPQEMGCGCGMTCWRRLRDWQAAGVWERLHKVLLDELGRADAIDWSRAALDASSVPAKGGAKKPARTRRTAESRARSITSS